MENKSNFTHAEKGDQGASCNARVSTGFTGFLLAAAIVGVVLWLILR
jgi:hypothetical protein